MIHHHPDDDLLLALAAGRSAEGPALLLEVHLESCASCRERLRTLEAVGGALLESEEPQLLVPESLARTLARIDTPAPAPRPAPATGPLPALPNGASWPRALRDCGISGWRWVAPGIQFSRVTLPRDPQASLYLLKIAPGKSLARHTHAGVEFTQVLCGAFDDGRDRFAAGDFDAAGDDVHHQPVVAGSDVCVCLACVDGRLRFDGRIAAAIGSWIGM